MGVHVGHGPGSWPSEPKLGRPLEPLRIVRVHERRQLDVLVDLLQHLLLPGLGVAPKLHILDAPIERGLLRSFGIGRACLCLLGNPFAPQTDPLGGARAGAGGILLHHLGSAEDGVGAKVVAVPGGHRSIFPQVFHDEDAAVLDMPIKQLAAQFRSPVPQLSEGRRGVWPVSPIGASRRLRVERGIQRQLRGGRGDNGQGETASQ
mmetsp:Transcript_66016/g.143896  ORF Transcript_66016/g.143896 Transcript_66016/m.143896 type:complete len:205 (+) Transcript_66016:822-1436(+)